jgi:hypothetical protein
MQTIQKRINTNAHSTRETRPRLQARLTAPGLMIGQRKTG